jgi:O-Antigen ligase
MLTAAAFLVAYSVCCLLALVRHPIYGLVTYVGLIYADPPAQWWGSHVPSIRWSLITALVTLVAVAIHRPKLEGPRVFEFGLMKGLVVFLIWLLIQLPWALDRAMQMELIVVSAKYTLLAALIYWCVDSSQTLRMLLWAHAVGCFYMGTVVFTEYIGGRFNGFAGAGIGEANVGALLLSTGILTTFVLFLAGRLVEKCVAVGFMPFILNAVIATISRSGFLALGIAGVIFNVLAPTKGLGTVRMFSLAGLALFLVLTNQTYWERIGTILEAGAEVEGLDTGAKRLDLAEAQFRMFSRYPLGCGHRCTAVLSPDYLDERHLTGVGDKKARSSHNTFMSLLVEQGVPGAVFYALLLLWVARASARLRHSMRAKTGLEPYTYAATIAILAAITVGDMFVDYLKFEGRVWFLALLMVFLRMQAVEQSRESLALGGDTPENNRSAGFQRRPNASGLKAPS